MNVNEVAQNPNDEMVDNSLNENGFSKKLLDNKSLVGSSLQKEEVIDLESTQIKNNVDDQLTVYESKTSDNADDSLYKTSIKQSLLSGNNEGKSILENFLTRPLSTPFHGGSQYNSMDNRKVEPLKINLHREPIKTVIKIPPLNSPEQQQHSPKIIIKPIKPPSTVQGTSEFESDSRSHKTHNKNSHENIESLRNNSDSHSETHVVPKLTIRNISHQSTSSISSSVSSSSNECSSSTHAESFHAIVPKLTIKIDHQNSQEFISKLDQSPKTHDKKSKQEDSMLTADGVKLTIKPIPEPPIPKLTIKTSVSDGSPISHNYDVPQPSSIPKLFIKPIQPEMECPGSDEDDSNENSVEASVEHVPIPKLTLKTSSVERTVIPETTLTTPTVPKLILKMGGSKIVCGDDLSDTTEPIYESDCVTSEKSSPEQKQTSSETKDNCETNQIISLVDDSESNMETNEDDLEPLVQSVCIKQQPEITTSTVVQENPNSPRIILKINKSSTTDVKSVSEPVSVLKSSRSLNLGTKDFNTGEQKGGLEEDYIGRTSLQDHGKNKEKQSSDGRKSIKRSQNDNESDLEFEKEELIKKRKFSHPNEANLENTQNTLEECTVISDDDTNDDKSEMCIDQQQTEVDDVYEDEIEKQSKEFEPEAVCITIDDDSSSVEKIKNENLPSTTVDNTSTTEVTKITEECIGVTPVKRGRGRPKKIIQPVAIKSPKENESHEKEDGKSDPDQKTDKQVEVVKTPSRGRGRGRGRGGRTVEVVRDGKVLQVKMDAGYEDDDSPTFSIYNRYATTRGRGRGSRGKRGIARVRKSVSNEGAQSSSDPNKTSNSSLDSKQFLLQKSTLKLNNSGSLQIFEEDTLMGGDIFQTPFRNLPDFPDDSQSSQVSSASATNEGRERKRGKMEVCEPEGRTEFTVDMLAEYEWPPVKYGQKHRSSETYMVQEQISEYLGIKSFKRKYPDLVRRPVEMEERNFMMERGLVSEKMCDLGLTAVVASEILDIMCNDYPEKYEEYRRYQREKQFLEFSHRQKLLRFEQENKGQLQKDKAIETAAAWNATFNKERLLSRKSCIDLQTLVVHIPKSKSEQITAQNKPIIEKTNYPISLVPGQFSEFFKSYSAEELACYPVNTVLIHHSKLEAILKEQDELTHNHSSTESESSESDSESDYSIQSEFDSSSDSSCGEEDKIDEESDPLCAVCDLTQYKNTYGQPEIFIECTACHRKAHPTCIKMPLKMVKRAMEYNWKCAECKNCSKCMRTTDESKMLFCGQCDRGYHIYCLGLRNVPDGHWYCNICTICTKCGTKNPEGNPNPLLTPNQRQNLAMVANWTHLYRTNNITKLREHYRTLCVPCAKLKNS